MTAAKWLALVGPVLLLAACATTRSGVLAVKRLDRNEFEVTSHAIGTLGGADDMRAKNDRIAAAFCAEKGQDVGIVNRRGYGGAASQDILQFRCENAAATAPPPRPTASAE